MTLDIKSYGNAASIGSIAQLGAATLRAAALAAFALACHAATAQTTLVIGYGPGSRPDLVARTLAAEMGEASGEIVVIQSLPGGLQATAMTVAKSVDARRDGRTLYLFLGGAANTPPEVSAGFRGLVPVALIGRGDDGWVGAFAPAGTPASVVARAEPVMIRAAQSSKVSGALNMLKMSGGGGAAQLAALIESAPPTSSGGQAAGGDAPVFGGSARGR